MSTPDEAQEWIAKAEKDYAGAVGLSDLSGKELVQCAEDIFLMLDREDSRVRTCLAKHQPPLR